MSAALHRVGTATTGRPAERRPIGRRMRRLGVGIFFTSIAVNAALGIYALLSPDWGDTQGKILATSLCVTGAILMALACEPAWERGLLGPVPFAGALLGALAFGMTIVGIWVEPAGDLYGKITGSTFTIAAACIVASLLVLAQLSPRHRWVFTLTLALLATGAMTLVISFWLGNDPSEVYLRAMGVVLIVLAAFVLTVPVLHWLDRGVLAAVAASSDAVRFCPYCGGKLTGRPGAKITCGRCGRGFAVTTSVTNLT